TGVEVPAEHAQPYGRLGATLSADHPGRPRAGSLTEGVPLEQDDLAVARALEEPRRPGPDRPAADDDDIRTPGHTRHGGHVVARCPRLNSQSNTLRRSRPMIGDRTCTDSRPRISSSRPAPAASPTS